MQNVREARIEDKADVLIIERIEHLATVAARLHKVRRSEDSELVAHHRLFQIQLFSNLVHRDFARKHEVDDADARRIAEELEELRQFEQDIHRNIAIFIFNT